VLTVKLEHQQEGRLRIIECKAVSVAYTNGHAALTLETDDLTEYQFVLDNKQSTYNVAYVENSAGQTTQVVRPRRQG